ncbi:hypothetical protein [Sphingobacterium spiritivorum]|uniref:hypothetical protein n=1 Tax=Sphingobacterium spiritivorum TaxID=258 RepID=UPI003DA31E9A
MKLKRVVTLFTAIVAVGTALAGTAGAKNLLIEEGWYRNADGTDPISTDTASQECQGTEVSCAYYFANDDDTEPTLTLHQDVN